MFMATFYYILLFVVLAIIVFFIRSFIIRKRNIPVELFTEALRDENSGHFEAALRTYENALNEEKKIIFHTNGLKNRIADKLKVLHTIIEYKNNFHITR